MSSLVSVRLNDDLLKALKIHANALHLTQTEYIRQAIEHMNAEADKIELRNKLKRASLKVRDQSLAINREFSDIERDPDDEQR